jgi:Tol biopolymer transport system component
VIGALTLLLAAATTAAAAPGLAYMTGGTKPLQVWSADADGSHARRLGPGVSPALSPNGAMVAATLTAQHGHALAIYPSNGGKPRSYLDIHQVNARPLAWSPDSRYLAVALIDNQTPNVGQAGLELVDTRTGHAAKVASGVIQGASFAPTGADRVVYALAASTQFSSTTNLFSRRAAGGSATQLTHDGHSLYPVWGKRGIAFDEVQSVKTKSPAFSIALLHGGHKTQITHMKISLLQDGLEPIAVSGDGRHLLAEFIGEDTSEAFAVDLVTHKKRELKVAGQPVPGWGISRDGTRVLVDIGGFENPASDGTVETVPFSGGNPTVLVRHAGNPSWNQ